VFGFLCVLFEGTLATVVPHCRSAPYSTSFLMLSMVILTSVAHGGNQKSVGKEFPIGPSTSFGFTRYSQKQIYTSAWVYVSSKGPSQLLTSRTLRFEFRMEDIRELHTSATQKPCSKLGTVLPVLLYIKWAPVASDSHFLFSVWPLSADNCRKFL